MVVIRTSPVSMDAADGRPGAGQLTFDEVLDRYQAEIYRFAAHLTRNRADADQLYRQTLLEASRAFDRLDATAPLRVWLYTLATTAFLSDRPTCGREDPHAEERAAEIPLAPPEHAVHLPGGDLLREVEACVVDLPRKQWVALVQRRHHDLSYEEIAATLCCSDAAARASVYEALRTLRDRLGARL